jgi:hypothetical protein
MGGTYYHIWSAWDPGTSPEDRKEWLMEQRPVRARTHGCSCCSSEEDPTVKTLDAHIAELKKDLAYAEAIKAKMIAWEAKLLDEQEIKYEEGRGAGIEEP